MTLANQIPWKVMLRDGALIMLALAVLFWAREVDQPELIWRWPAALLAAALLALVGYLIHEWGHLTGALISRASVVLPAGITDAFLFRWDSARNSRRQFFFMASGGFVASIVTVIGYVLWLDWALLPDRVALILMGLGVLATFIIEVPEFWRVARGGPIPNGAAFVSE